MNEWKRMHDVSESYRRRYPAGTRILLICMGEDIHRVPDNTRGTVKMVDDTGTLHCVFDNGKSLGLIPGEDRFRKLTQEELAEEEATSETDNGMGMGR